MSLAENAVATTKFVDDKDYLIWGFPFYNNEFKMDEFSQAFEVLKEQ